ncbi:MAG: NADH-quinone oxidoreductase subunit K [Microthrixaceae bacterium]|nr:NADH-quinone oxidoreductase subunit K [Microthrixaceae bacterium]
MRTSQEPSGTARTPIGALSTATRSPAHTTITEHRDEHRAGIPDRSSRLERHLPGHAPDPHAIILGLGMLGNAVNLLILTSGSRPGSAPIVGRDGSFTDPVPQALVLTAIVITFGVLSFLLAMAYRGWTIDGNDEVEDDIADRRLAEEPDEHLDHGDPT